jgi:integrase
VWVIPAERMKMRLEFMVPLSKQAVKILKKLKAHSNGRYLFPSSQTEDRPLSENTLNQALRRMGYAHDVHVSHGFRVTASTLLHELEYDESTIELQLAHKVPGVAGIYNRAAKIGQRTKLVQDWADYLDRIKAA